jgi:citronellol/citronellal dehydrogenase
VQPIPSDAPLAGRTLLMSGGSRGIGLAIALRAARDGANITLLAKTAAPDRRLPGTIHTAANAIREAGGQALAVVGDVRSEEDVTRAVDGTVSEFGGLDMVVNNASAIALQPTADLSTKRYDLMMGVNARGTFLLTRAALPHLLVAEHPKVLTLSPPLNVTDTRWLTEHAPYTLSKYGMTMITIGLAGAHANAGLSATCLWPGTYIATAAVANVAGGPDMMRRARRPEIMADAAHTVLAAEGREYSGRCLIDDEVLTAAGVRDLSLYLAEGADADDLATDLFL